MTADSLELRAASVTNQLLDLVDGGGRLAVVQAPPGSGKTYLLTQGIARGRSRNLRIAVAAQTNAQADDICRRLAGLAAPVTSMRFARKTYTQQNLGSQVQWITETRQLPNLQDCTVVATTAKWSAINIAVPFDILFIDEAWQMAWADFMPLGQVASRFVLIGDPGQISPVVSVDTSRCLGGHLKTGH